jgi:hypothetical protein
VCGLIKCLQCIVVKTRNKGDENEKSEECESQRILNSLRTREKCEQQNESHGGRVPILNGTVS